MGDAGVMLVAVVVMKPGVARTFAVVDGAMNDLIRPTLYDAWHDIVPVRQPVARNRYQYQPGESTIIIGD